jgi:phosphatidylinositol-3,4,5-trisphosphate 3-phosphatase/dual-specificity protein phosphatase PTEN
MFEVIRGLVSGKKTRYQDENYDLDLTYITPRIIAMSYPADSYDRMYRNDINTVGQFLKERHGDKFIVMNMACKKYPAHKIFGYKSNNIDPETEKQLNKKIHIIDWKDHHSPFLPYLVNGVQIMHDHL